MTNILNISLDIVDCDRVYSGRCTSAGPPRRTRGKPTLTICSWSPGTLRRVPASTWSAPWAVSPPPRARNGSAWRIDWRRAWRDRVRFRLLTRRWRRWSKKCGGAGNPARRPEPTRPPAAAGLAVDPDQVSVEEAREAGAVHAGHQVWQQLGLNEILSQVGLSARACQLSEAMTLNRLIFPLSEHAMPDWMRRTALPDILGTDFSALPTMLCTATWTVCIPTGSGSKPPWPNARRRCLIWMTPGTCTI